MRTLLETLYFHYAVIFVCFAISLFFPIKVLHFAQRLLFALNRLVVSVIVVNNIVVLHQLD